MSEQGRPLKQVGDITQRLREYASAGAVGFVLVILLFALTELPAFRGAAYVLAPGMLLAAVVFPEGVHSSWAMIYIVVALIFDALLLGGPIWWFWNRLLKTSRNEDRKS